MFPINRHLFVLSCCYEQWCCKFCYVCLHLLPCKDFLGQWGWGQSQSMFFPSVLYLRLHFPDSCVPCLASGLSQWEALARKRGERGQSAYLSATQTMLPLHLQLPPHRSTLVLASTQILQQTPGLLTASLVCLYRRGGSGLLKRQVIGCLTVCDLSGPLRTSQSFQPTRHQPGHSARPLSMHSRTPGPSNPVTRQGYLQTIGGPAGPLAGAPVGKQPTVSDRWGVRRPTLWGWRSWGGGEVRGGSGLSPWDPPAHPASGQWVSRAGARGAGWGLCPAGFQSPSRPDLGNKGSDTKKFVTTKHIPPSPFLKLGFAENFWVFGGFKAGATCLLAWPSINLSLLQTLMFWYCLASMCIRHMDLCFGNTTSNYLRGIKLFAYLFFLQKALLFPFGPRFGQGFQGD